MSFVPLLGTVLLSAEPEIVVKDFTLKKAEFDSFADVLHIIQKGGTVELSGAEPALLFFGMR